MYMYIKIYMYIYIYTHTYIQNVLIPPSCILYTTHTNITISLMITIIGTMPHFIDQ